MNFFYFYFSLWYQKEPESLLKSNDSFHNTEVTFKMPIKVVKREVLQREIMKILLFFIFQILLIVSAHCAQHGWGTSFSDGQQKVKIGGRIQGILSNENVSQTQDLYLRRLRLNVYYSPWKDHSLYYDIRNDSVGEADEGEGNFVIGDAFWKIDFDHNYINDIKLFRAKVDVSYSQTASSKNLFTPLRAQTSEKASDFVVHNRRATNIQLNGNLKQLAYHIVLSDGVNSGDLKDVSGNSITKIEGQKLTYGGKFRYYFVGDAKKNQVQDTFYGQARSISLGLGYFANDKVLVQNNNYSNKNFTLSRQLTNFEISIAYDELTFLAEAFQFNGDLIDLTQNTKDQIIGNSGGYYSQIEYTFGKWAPFIRLETFNRNQAEDDYLENSTTYGLNYYHLLEAIRFGLAWTDTDYEESLNQEDSQQLYSYIMLNF